MTSENLPLQPTEGRIWVPDSSELLTPPQISKYSWLKTLSYVTTLLVVSLVGVFLFTLANPVVLFVYGIFLLALSLASVWFLTSFTSSRQTNFHEYTQGGASLVIAFWAIPVLIGGLALVETQSEEPFSRSWLSEQAEQLTGTPGWEFGLSQKDKEGNIKTVVMVSEEDTILLSVDDDNGKPTATLKPNANPKE